MERGLLLLAGEAFGSPCHEGAHDPISTRRHEASELLKEGRNGRSRRSLRLVKKYRDAKRDISGRWAMGVRSGAVMKGSLSGCCLTCDRAGLLARVFMSRRAG